MQGQHQKQNSHAKVITACNKEATLQQLEITKLI